MIRRLKPPLVVAALFYVLVMLWTNIAWGATARSATSASINTGTSCSFGPDSNPTTDSQVIFVSVFTTSVTVTNEATLGLAGWTLLDNVSSESVRTRVYSNGQNQQLTTTIQFSNSVGFVCVRFTVSGADNTNPIDVGAGGTIAGAPFDTPTIIPTHNGEFLLGYWIESTGTLTIGAPSDMTNWAGGNQNPSAAGPMSDMSGTRTQATAASVSEQATKGTGTESDGTAWLIAFQEPQATPTITPTQTPTPTTFCCGDRNGDGVITTANPDELTACAICAANPPPVPTTCAVCDCNHDGDVTTAEVAIVQAEVTFGCGFVTPTPTVTPTVTITPTATTTPTNLPDSACCQYDIPLCAPPSGLTHQCDAFPNGVPVLGAACVNFIECMPWTPTPSPTGTIPTPTATVPSATPTTTATRTLTQTPTITQTRTETPTATITLTPTSGDSPTPTETPTESPTATESPTTTESPTASATATTTPTLTIVPSATITPTQTVTPTPTQTTTVLPTATNTPIPRRCCMVPLFAGNACVADIWGDCGAAEGVFGSTIPTPIDGGSCAGTFPSAFCATLTPTVTATITLTPTITPTGHMACLTPSPTASVTPTTTPTATVLATATRTPCPILARITGLVHKADTSLDKNDTITFASDITRPLVIASCLYQPVPPVSTTTDGNGMLKSISLVQGYPFSVTFAHGGASQVHVIVPYRENVDFNDLIAGVDISLVAPFTPTATVTPTP